MTVNYTIVKPDFLCKIFYTHCHLEMISVFILKELKLFYISGAVTREILLSLLKHGCQSFIKIHRDICLNYFGTTQKLLFN